MTDNQLAAFLVCIETVSTRVSRHFFSLTKVKTAADLKEFFGFSHGQIASMTGYSRAHVAAVVNYGREFTPLCLDAFRDIERQAVKKILGDSYSIRFKGEALGGDITRTCPTCGREHPVIYRGDSPYCHYHRGR